MDAMSIQQYNHLSLPGSDRVIEAVRQQLADSGLEMPENANLQSTIRVIGDSVTGYPIKKVVLRVVMEATDVRCIDQVHTIPFRPTFQRRQSARGHHP